MNHQAKSQSKSYVVSDNQRKNFQEKGAVLLPALLDGKQLIKLQRAADKALAKSENYFHRQRVWEDDEILRAFCLQSQAPGIAAQLMQTKHINLFYDQVFTKEPQTNAPTPWHNDQPYWPVRGNDVMTVWLALDDITMESGPMEFIAGSHLWNKWYQPFRAALDGGDAGPYPATEEGFEPLPDFDKERDKHEILCWEMLAGDAIAFHALTVHGAKGNISPNLRRRGYAIRYTGADARYHESAVKNLRLLNPTLKHGNKLDSDQYPCASIN